MTESLWNFSIAVYSERGVQNECLHLQEQFGLDVNMILFCAFAGAVHGICLTEDDIVRAQKEVARWQEDVVKPVRATRRNLKRIELGSDGPFVEQAAKLNDRVKAAEIESEHIEQGMLEALLATRVGGRARYGVHEALVANLQTLLNVNRIGREGCVFETLMKSLTVAACAYSPRSDSAQAANHD